MKIHLQIVLAFFLIGIKLQAKTPNHFQGSEASEETSDNAGGERRINATPKSQSEQRIQAWAQKNKEKLSKIKSESSESKNELESQLKDLIGRRDSDVEFDKSFKDGVLVKLKDWQTGNVKTHGMLNLKTGKFEMLPEDASPILKSTLEMPSFKNKETLWIGNRRFNNVGSVKSGATLWQEEGNGSKDYSLLFDEKRNLTGLKPE